MPSPAYSTWLEIDLSAIQNNIRQIAAAAGSPVMAVVKANGYGHGMVEVARAALEAGACGLGVARIDEALQLRQSGITQPVLVMGYCSPERAAEAAAQNIALTIYDFDLAKEYSAAAARAANTLRLHIKVDTGMGRLGVFPVDALEFTSYLNTLPNLGIEGIFTHFARADEPSLAETDLQIDRFLSVLSALSASGIRPRQVHAANSAGALNYPRAAFDFVRAGIAIYGLHPSPTSALSSSFRPALSWKAALASVKELPAGHGVGYTHRYITTQAERIGVLPVGYADGLRRQVGVNFALVGGVRVPVVGGVCMDQSMLKLDSVPSARAGDEVVLIGRQASESITAEEIGAAWGTINYEVVCALAARIARLYT
jgi:alanine racemase